MSLRPGVELNGLWSVHAAQGDLHQRFVDPAFDDSGWPQIPVPGHWRAYPPLDRTDGPVLYRRRVPTGALADGQRRFLAFDGAFYYGDVWFDGAYLGATEGYFSRHSFELKGSAAQAGEHVLAVEMACPPERDRRNKRMITGVFSHWDNLDPTWNPGGLWRPVWLTESGRVHVTRSRVLCTEATGERGRLLVHFTVDSAAPLACRLTAKLRGPGLSVDAEKEQSLATGENQLSWTLAVERPPRWWPWRYGPQPLCDLEVEISVDGEPSDTVACRTAFRDVKVENWRWSVNGERIFVMGCNQGPARMDLAGADPAGLAADIALAREANLDVLRLHGHVTRPEVYAAADETGILLWQDMPLQWGYGWGARKPAAAQARDLVDRVGHHPSVALWCAHNEPYPGPAEKTGDGTPSRSRWKAAGAVLLPSWNKDILDRSVARALSRHDGTRPVIEHSGVLPGALRPGTDSHLYLGWYSGRPGDLAGALRRWPRLARFVSEFGAQAVPDSAAFMEADRWPHLDWPLLEGHHALQKGVFDRLVPPADYATFDAWREATQAYQAALIQLQAEDLRRLRHRPTGGFLHFCFADGHPGVTWSVLDHERQPKAGFAALQAACRSVLPMVDPRRGHVHVANEERRPFEAAQVEVILEGVTWRFEGDVPADSLAYIGRVEVGEATSFAEIRLTHPDLGEVKNTYGPTLWDSLRS
jgi:beta-mannosidase